MGCGILVGYFSKQDEARKAVSKLARNGFRRIALVHKGTDGVVHVADPFLWIRFLIVTAAACLAGGVGGVTALHMNWPLSLSITLFSAAIGAMAMLFWLRRSRYVVEPGVLRDHARWLMSGESVPDPPGDPRITPASGSLQRESAKAPALFVMHPKRERRIRGAEQT